MTSQPRVVAIGGGTGLATLLRGLKKLPLAVTAVVTMTDNGQSSGRLSRDLGVLPPGDVRKCLAALAKDEALLAKLFEYRFKGSRGISGHTAGNLLLLALSDITGSFDRAIQESSRILSIRGRVVPSTLEHVALLAKLGNGQMALGEVDIPRRGHVFGISEVQLIPEKVKANPEALAAIKEAEVIIIGPGSLFTSIIPNFLIADLRRAVEHASAKKYFVCNVSTERGETERFTVRDHVEALDKYLEAKLDLVIVNSKTLSYNGRGYKLGSVQNITTQEKQINGSPVVCEDLVNDQQPLHHDPDKLAATIWRQISSWHACRQK